MLLECFRRKGTLWSDKLGKYFILYLPLRDYNICILKALGTPVPKDLFNPFNQRMLFSLWNTH